MIKTITEEGHYTIKLVDKLPKKGNFNWLYAIRGAKLDKFYKPTQTGKYENIQVGTSIEIFEDTELNYDSTTHILEIKFADGHIRTVSLPNKTSDFNNDGDGVNPFATTDITNAILDVIKVPPNYIQPSVSISTIPINVEKGTTLIGQAINIGFTQNDAGAPTAFLLEMNNSSISTFQNSTISISNIVNVTTIKGTVSYQEGVTKNNNLGLPDTEGKVLAGNKSASKSITPRLKFFYGNSNSIPTNSANVRSLVSNQYETSSTINLSTGTTNLNFIVAIPANYSLTNAIDTGNLNSNITSQYTLRATFNVDDAGGNPESYKLYAMTNSVAYNPTTNHQITIA